MQTEKIETKFNRGQNVVVQQFVPTIDSITGYHLYAMLIMLLDLITYFINKTAEFSTITPTANFIIAVFVMISEMIDLCVVAIYGITRKIKWFTSSYILYSASSISTLVAIIMILFAKQTFEEAFSWQLGFLSIFRGNVRSVQDKNKAQGKLYQTLRKSSNVRIVSYVIYVTRVIRAIFQSLYGILIFIFLFMGTVFLNERAQESKRSFIDLLYFITVTMSTVGYGDITLDGSSGRIITITFIIIALIYIPVALGISIQKLSNELPRLKLLRQVYGGVITIGQKHVQLAQSLRAVFPQQQSISVLVTDANQNYDDHPDMKQFIESVTQMQFMIKDQYDNQSLKDMQLDSSLIVLVYANCQVSREQMAESDGVAIIQAVIAAQTLKEDNLLVVILQSESSVLICKEKIHEYLEEQQCIVYSLSKIYSNIIYLSSLYNGFSTFFINCLLPYDCQLNRYEQEIKRKTIKNFKSCCTADHEAIVLDSQDYYNKGCGQKNLILNASQTLKEKYSKDIVSVLIQELLVVISGEFNDQLLNSTLSLFRSQNIQLFIIYEDSDLKYKNDSDILVEGDIYDTNFYVKQGKEIIVFMANNDGKEVLIHHAVKQSGLEHNICCMESLVEIQQKFDYYKSQKYIPCGLSGLCTMVIRNPLSFQKIFSFIEDHHKFQQYEIQSTITIVDWQKQNQDQFILFVNRNQLIINLFDEQFELNDNDIITAAIL